MWAEKRKFQTRGIHGTYVHKCGRICCSQRGGNVRVLGFVQPIRGEGTTSWPSLCYVCARKRTCEACQTRKALSHDHVQVTANTRKKRQKIFLKRVSCEEQQLCRYTPSRSKCYMISSTSRPTTTAEMLSVRITRTYYFFFISCRQISFKFRLNAGQCNGEDADILFAEPWTTDSRCVTETGRELVPRIDLWDIATNRQLNSFRVLSAAKLITLPSMNIHILFFMPGCRNDQTRINEAIVGRSEEKRIVCDPETF